MAAKKQKRVLVALSGGIDSAVSAYLLVKKGYKVEAAFMKNWSSTAGLLKNECPWLTDRQDALRVAAFLNITLHTLDFEKQYEKTVMRYFFKEYKAGRTPNPDVMCNKEIKFKLLYNWAMRYGFDNLATGHYARVEGRGNSKFQISNSKKIQNSKAKNPSTHIKYGLMRSADEFKDQTYFIYNIKTGQLPHVLFPIGGMKKSAVRLLARKIGLPNAEKKESMGLCFVGKIRLKDFLEQKLKAKKGPIVLISSLKPTLSVPMDRDISPLKGEKNNVLRFIGRHEGLHNYTIGQRQGIKVGGGGPYYVVSKDLKKNLLYVTNDSDDNRLMTKEVQLHSVNWINKQISESANKLISLTGRYRHQGELVPVEVSAIDNKYYRVIFKHPQKAVASGQSLVLYKGKECVGGGIIA